MTGPRDLLILRERDAYKRYDSTCRLGGSPSERKWACDQAVEASVKVSHYDLHANANAPTQKLEAVK